MTITVAPIDAERYARIVLPETFALWGDGRTYERYVEDFTSVARSPFGRRRPFTVGLHEGDAIVSSCKNYARELHWGKRTLSAVGIGAVFTPQALRGRGYASAMLGALLDDERAKGTDLAFLYSDIHPAYYERLGFVALPSRAISLRTDSLDVTPCGAVEITPDRWSAVRGCFDAFEARRDWGFKRTPAVWGWMRARWSAPLERTSQAVSLVIEGGKTATAYAIGRRVVQRDAFVVDDFAFANDVGRALVPALLRMAAGDLRRVTGWLPPFGAREALPRGSVRARKSAILMIAALSSSARAWWKAERERILGGSADAAWSADHV